MIPWNHSGAPTLLISAQTMTEPVVSVTPMGAAQGGGGQDGLTQTHRLRPVLPVGLGNGEEAVPTQQGSSVEGQSCSRAVHSED